VRGEGLLFVVAVCRKGVEMGELENVLSVVDGLWVWKVEMGVVAVERGSCGVSLSSVGDQCKKVGVVGERRGLFRAVRDSVWFGWGCFAL
jgi:hypothetical protein